jgi:hypothetical protein
MLTREELGDKYVWVQIKHKEMEVVVHAIRSRSKPQAGKDVLSKISFWIGQQGLDKFVQVCSRWASSLCISEAELSCKL